MVEAMTDDPTWRARVEAMIEQARQHQDELFYQKTLPGWLAELRSLERGDDLARDTPEHTTPLQGAHTS